MYIYRHNVTELTPHLYVGVGLKSDSKSLYYSVFLTGKQKKAKVVVTVASQQESHTHTVFKMCW